MSLKSQIKSLIPDKALLHLQALDHWIEGEPELRRLPHCRLPAP